MLHKKTPETVAAVDLGSNSFHMIVARLNGGQLSVLDRLKETVRLAAGLDADNKIGFEAGQRALACLARFGQRLRDLPQGVVRAVGTNTLRKARNAQAFLSEARHVLGHPIEVISGREEARLIYLGVAHTLADEESSRLVIDIGGGSTELIIGRRFEAQLMESLHMGCVGMTAAHFADGRISADSMRRAVIAARLELRPVVRLFRQLGWQQAVGSSGTLISVARIVREMGWSHNGITLDSLYKLRDALLDAGSIKKLSLTGLSRDRAEVFAGGVAILLALFEGLRIECMGTSEGALREGLAYDLIGRIRHEDVRGRTVEGLMSRFQVDKEQAAHVEATALWLFERVAEVWSLNEDHGETLQWAACLHEVGLSIAHSQYQKHGGYLLQNADMPGFSRPEQQILATLVRTHRRKFTPSQFELVAPGETESVMRLSVLLRLAALLNRNRDQSDIPIRGLRPQRSGLEVEFEPGAMEVHPLTRADLETEVEWLKGAGFRLKFR